MNFTKTNRLAGVLGAAMALGMGLSATVAHAQPQFTIRGEEAAHPRLHAAIHQMREALKELKEAPDDFGGNKAAAIRDTEQAIHSLKKALYHRLKMDDAAIDKAQ
jgi:hypothetical protein